MHMSAPPGGAGAPPHLSAIPGAAPGGGGVPPGNPRQEIPLFDAVSLLTQLLGKPVSVRALVSEVARQGASVGAGQVIGALKQHGFSAKLARRELSTIPVLALPAVIILSSGNACVLRSVDNAGNAEVLLCELGVDAPRRMPLSELAGHYAGWVLFARPAEWGTNPAHDPLRTDAPAGISWFWRVLWGYRRYYVESALAAVIINVLGLAMSLFTMNVYDRVVPNHALDSLWVLAIGVSLAIVFEFIVRTLRGHFMDVAAKKADLTISSRIFKHVLGMRGEVRPGSAGNFAAQVQGFETVREFIGSAALVAFSDLPFVGLYLWTMSQLGGELVWVSLITIPVVIGTSLLIQVPLNAAIHKATREGYSKQGVLIETIEGIDTLKALNAEGFALGQWERASTAAAQSTHTSRTWSALAVNFSNLALQFATVATVVLGVHLVVEGKLTQGALVACVMLSGRALGPLSQIAGLLARFHHARSAYQALKKMMDLPTERTAGKQYLHRPRFNGALELRDLQYRYPSVKPGRPLLDIGGLAFRPGEKIAILGRIGTGKSTLLHVLSGLLSPTAGTVLCDGIDQSQIDPADVRQNISLVSQHSRLFRGTLRDNLVLGAPHVDTQAMVRYAQLCGVHDWVTRHPLGYDMPIAEGGANLSGGQRQMVALARGLLVGAPILLLDEPTSALDHMAEQQLLMRLKQELRRQTLVLVSHKPSTLVLVERIVVIDDGRVVADGPRDAVLQMLNANSAGASRAAGA